MPARVYRIGFDSPEERFGKFNTVTDAVQFICTDYMQQIVEDDDYRELEVFECADTYTPNGFSFSWWKVETLKKVGE